MEEVILNVIDTCMLYVLSTVDFLQLWLISFLVVCKIIQCTAAVPRPSTAVV